MSSPRSAEDDVVVMNCAWQVVTVVGLCLVLHLTLTCGLLIARYAPKWLLSGDFLLPAQAHVLAQPAFVGQLSTQPPLMLLEAFACIVALASNKVVALSKLCDGAVKRDAERQRQQPQGSGGGGGGGGGAMGMTPAVDEDQLREDFASELEALAPTRSARVLWVRDSQTTDFNLLLNVRGSALLSSTPSLHASVAPSRAPSAPASVNASLQASAAAGVMASVNTTTSTCSNSYAAGTATAAVAARASNPIRLIEDGLFASISDAAVAESVSRALADDTDAAAAAASAVNDDDDEGRCEANNECGALSTSSTLHASRRAATSDTTSTSAARASGGGTLRSSRTAGGAPRASGNGGRSTSRRVVVPPARGLAGWGSVRFLSAGMYGAWRRFACSYGLMSLVLLLLVLAFPRGLAPLIIARQKVYWLWVVGSSILSNLFFLAFLYAPLPPRAPPSPRANGADVSAARCQEAAVHAAATAAGAGSTSREPFLPRGSSDANDGYSGGPSYREPWVNDKRFLRRIGVVVPCHKSADEIGDTLRSLLRYFEPQHIVVCDNGNNLTPNAQDGGATRAVVDAVSAAHLASCTTDHEHGAHTTQHRKIHYFFIPEGHKTQALCVGALKLHRLGLDYILHIDGKCNHPHAKIRTVGWYRSEL